MTRGLALVVIARTWNGEYEYTRFEGRGDTNIVTSPTPLTAEHVKEFRDEPERFLEGTEPEAPAAA